MFYVSAWKGYSVFYLTDLEDKPEGWGGLDHGTWTESYLRAIDYKTGKFVGVITGAGYALAYRHADDGGWPALQRR